MPMSMQLKSEQCVAMTRYVDYAVEGTPFGLCAVLPGRQYTPEGPLLSFAAQAALMRGWDVRQV
jgi:hypothetical protein